MSLRRFILVAVLGLLFTATAAWAGPKEDMVAVGKKFLTVRSYHAVMTNSDPKVPKMQMEFVAPDRYRMRMPMGAQVVIGDTMYMTMDGRTMRIPLQKGTMTQWRESDRMFRELDKTTIEALGSEAIDGKPAKKYRLIRSDLKSTSLVWVGGDGYPVKMETTGTAGKRASAVTVLYSRFNDPSIKIDVPK
jgi:outer membrane lipoprotein-sorting protein